MRALGFVVIAAVAACGDDTGPPDARRPDAEPAGGTVSLTWSIADEGAPLSCEGVGSTLVSLTMVPEDQVFGTTDSFTCGTGAGTSRVIPGGVYDITATLGGVDIAPLRFDDVTVVSGQDTSLGNATFEVDARGGFQFTIAAAGQDACGAPGVDAMQIALATTGGACTPATFDIPAGAAGGATQYTTDCTTPAPTVCIHNDQQVTAQPTVPSGAYRMTITGTIGGTPCWTKVAQFDVPAAGATENLPQQNLVLDTNNPACVP